MCGKPTDARLIILKIILNRASKALKNLLESERNQGIERYLSQLSSTAESTILCEKPPRGLNAFRHNSRP